MSLRKFSDANLDPRTWEGNDSAPWVRPSNWLALTALTESDQKFEGLHAVYESGSNFCALSAEGDFTINWGDGSGDTNVSSGVTAEKNIAWADAATTSDVGIADAVSCTFQDTGDTVTVVGHAFKNGERVAFNSITSTTGISTYTSYFVRDVATNTFKLAATRDGTALTLTTDGSGSVYRTLYRQVVVTVVPNAVNLTSLNLHVKHSQANLQVYASGFLDIALAGQYLTNLRLGVLTPNSPVQSIRFGILAQVNIVRSDLRQLSLLFYACSSLRSVLNLATSTAPAATSAVTFQDTGDTVTWANHGFRNGDSVVFPSITTTTGITVDTLYFVVGATTDTFQVSASHGGTVLSLTSDGSGTAVRGTNFKELFTGCYSLTEVPLFDTASVIDMTSMFSSCRKLVTVPCLNTASVTNMSSMFSNCNSLAEVPLLNTASVTSMNSMFNACNALTTVPLLNTASVTSMNSMFSSCYGLTTVPLFNTAAVTTMVSLFNNCFSLKEVPLFNVAAVTATSGMFSGCANLTTVPLLNTASVTNMTSMFSSCPSLTEVPALDCSGPTSGISSIFTSCNALASIHAYGFDQSFSVAGCKLSGAELDRLYTNLASAVATITVTNNWGNASDTPSIATSKGWTVTG